MLTAQRAPRTLDPADGDLLAAARRDASAAEQAGRLTPEVAAALTRAGFPRHFVPREQGGAAGEFGPLVTATATVAEACASTAWCAALFAAHGRLAAYLPPDGRREIWAGGPDRRIAAAVVPPQGRAVKERDGWRLDGTWRPASGVDHADWVLLASWVPAPTGREHRIFAVPRSELTVEDTWDACGLRGTGSNTVRAEGVRVPEHRSVPLQTLLRPQPGAARCHTVPFPMVAALIFAAPALGIARGALRAWTAERAGAPARHPATHTVLAEASARIHAAGLLLDGAAARADRGEITALTVAENRRDAATAATLCREAVDSLFRASGLRAHTPGSVLQRAWRDATTLASHGTLDTDAAARAYAEAVLTPEV
ncbi:oxidoreductase [Streptomyces thermoviolaceus]|uniref:oxidoreductase n=1 Tax=Streptomyces thermoviolaceus TaxID=1952 RepID=UPI00203E01C0|nr:oxidoreductase [Streptomyces thermoviolaceus]MCM3265201.1 oxidoreductase [Streptomyces thermoviolaceus]